MSNIEEMVKNSRSMKLNSSNNLWEATTIQQNWQNVGFDGLLRVKMRSEMAGTVLEYLMVKLTSFSRMGARPKQDLRM